MFPRNIFCITNEFDPMELNFFTEIILKLFEIIILKLFQKNRPYHMDYNMVLMSANP